MVPSGAEDHRISLLALGVTPQGTPPAGVSPDLSVPAPPPPGRATRSSPWRDTSRWLWTVLSVPAVAGRWWRRGCRDLSSNAPGAGAYPPPQPGSGPDGRRLRLT